MNISRKKAKLVILTVLLTSCAKSGNPNGSANATQGADSPPPVTCTGTAQSCEYTTAHNNVRTGASPAPSPALPAMSYSTSLESAADTWAQNCNFAYDPGLSGMGQNVFASTVAFTPTNVVATWSGQAADYTYSTNTCATGKVCGNYTQLVWRASNQVGCAVKNCASGSPFGTANGGNWFIAVCNYSPAGNIVGQSPY